MNNEPLTIAVDFDGTIVEHKFPKIGKELPFAIHTLLTLQKKGHRLILWTYRSGDELDEAVEFCKSRGLEFYAINKNYPEEKYSEKISRKILADLYIDDRTPEGMISWAEIYQRIHPEDGMAPTTKAQKKRRWW